MYSIFVTINIKPENVEAFKEASLGDSQGSVRDEPGGFRFDIHQDSGIPSRFYLHEVYRDRDAFQTHLKTPHFLVWKEVVTPFFDGEPSKHDMQTVFPSDDGWEKQKAGLLNF